MGKIPINLSSGKLAKESTVVGIDLGTTNSLIAYIDPITRIPKAIPDSNGNVSTPSLVFLGDDGCLDVGYEAREYSTKKSGLLVYSVKRLMGMTADEYEGLQSKNSLKLPTFFSPDRKGVFIDFGSDGYTPIQLSSLILSQLRRLAEAYLLQPVQKAVITVPAYFNDLQRQATREAGLLAGFEVLRIINEPTAASLAYGIGMGSGHTSRVVVYDLGGGTFDVSILDITDGIFEVLSTSGDTRLGGDDFDECIVDFWKESFGLSSAFVSTFGLGLRNLAERAKCILTTEMTFSGQLDGKDFSLSRERFEGLISHLVQRTLSACQQALDDARCSIDDIDEIVLVGGSTRVPFVVQQVSTFFGRSVRHSIDPDQVVALGAALQAEMLSGNSSKTLLLDVTPLSLGIETAGGVMDILIPRNSKIPLIASRQYTTQQDGQSGIKVSVYQGERDLVSENRELANFILQGIPSMPAGLPKVQVTFQINADGLLKVTAKELRSGISQSVHLSDELKIDNHFVEKMIHESIQHASTDMTRRKLAELIVEAQLLATQTHKFLAANKSELSEKESSHILEPLLSLEKSLVTDDLERIQAAMDVLNDQTRPIAERIMDITISKVLTGKDLSNLNG